jgi:hypothetical protein
MPLQGVKSNHHRTHSDAVGYGIMQYPDLPTNQQNRLLIFSHRMERDASPARFNAVLAAI